MVATGVEVNCAGRENLVVISRLNVEAARCARARQQAVERPAFDARRRAHRYRPRGPSIRASRVRVRSSGNQEQKPTVQPVASRESILPAIDRTAMLRSALVAALVGPVLTLVNQSDAVFGQRPLEPGKALLTLVVPFVVASVSGAMAGRRARRDAFARETSLTHLVEPLQASVETIRSNAATVNATARARHEETVALHQRARQAAGDIDGVAALVHHALAATAEVQEHFSAVLEAGAQVQLEVRNSAASAVAVSSAVAVARGMFSEIAALAHDIGRLGHQTTLLSLNAAVVAATSGAEGKRFAAIAESIRELARETGAQAKRIDATTRELEHSAAAMAKESDRLLAGNRRLLDCSDASKLALGQAAASMERSASPTRACMDLLATQSVHIRAISDETANVVGHAEATIEGSARNMALATTVGEALGGLAMSSRVGLRTGRS